MAAAVCKSCQEPLILQVEPDEEDDATTTVTTTSVPDDLDLACGCHFHWQCLLEQAPTVAVSHNCPACGAHLLSPSSDQGGSGSGSSTAGVGAQGAATTIILARYASEGGVQEALDMLPVLTEEAFLSAHPEARPARALHVMAAEGDITGMVDLLRDVEAGNDEDEDEDEDEEVGAAALDAAQLLRWTDPLNGGRTALHVAIERRQEEVLWLLLWLGSDLSVEAFPQVALATARGLGLDQRRPVERTQDVLFIRDESGRQPAGMLAQLGDPWKTYADQGLLTS